MNNVDMRKLSQKAQDALRARVMVALNNGMSQVKAAKVFGVSRQSAGRWLKLGDKALVSGRRGKAKGTNAKLSAKQARVIERLIADKHPEQLKLPFALWTRDSVRELIKERFGVKISRATASRYLKQWGFTAQKPVRRAIERDPQAVKRWLEEEYPAIRAKAKSEKAHILWGDEMSVRSDHAAGKSFSPKGKTPVIETTGRRFKCNIISAISNRGQLQFMTFRKSFNTDVFIEFLRRLVRKSRQRIFLIVDSHPAHVSAKVKRWLKTNERKIILYRLPAYCPELNPDELLNNDLKTNAVGRAAARTLKEMQGNVRSYLRITQRNPRIVRNYFREEHVRYASG